jgi:hypothetical protein
MLLGIVYLLTCLFVALLGTNRKMGFWGYFFGSILLTPLIGILLVLASDKRQPLYLKPGHTASKKKKTAEN